MSMKTTGIVAMAVLFGLCTLASAETILINFASSNTAAGGDGVLTNWNQAVKNSNSGAVPGVLSTVIDSDGNVLAGVTITVNNMYLNEYANSGTYASSGSVADWVDLDAIGMTWHGSSSMPDTSVTISGLTGPYRVDFIAARVTAGSGNDRIDSYYVNGVLSDGDASYHWSSHIDGWNNGGVLTWSSVTPDSGAITVTDGPDEGDHIGENAYYTAMRLVSVPEPATMSILAFSGMLGLIRRRRR